METFWTNIPIFALAAALVWTGVEWWLGKKSISEVCARRLLLLPNGIGGLWAFVFILFFSHEEAAFFSLPESGFQYRVAVANLAIGVSGIIAFWASFEFCLAVGFIASFFYAGLFIDHVVEIFLFRNVAAGNIGFLTTFKLVMAALLVVSLYNWHRAIQRHR